MSQACYTVGLLDEKRGVQVLHMDVDLLKFCKEAGSFELMKFGLLFLKGIPVVLGKPAFSLRRKGGANVDNGLNFAACTIVFRNGGVEHIIKLQVESFEFFTSVLILAPIRIKDHTR